ncbi:MAG: amidophosphoribosyltransferase [Bacteroidetes bacterium]|nr:amidophosphoribosyltransferase [Bacteroidota bacterium]
MSDAIKHECGIALVRLLKPLEYYIAKYGTAFYGFNKLYLLMQKQHNRGQDGAGIANIKLDMKPGNKYINRLRSNSPTSLKDVFGKVYNQLEKIKQNHPARINDVDWLKQHVNFIGELYIGHLRYGTFGGNTSSALHPFIRKNNWMTRNLAVAGNFNLTNMDQLFEELIEYGQYPVETSDTITILEKIGHFLDEENERLYQKFKKEGRSQKDISSLIAKELDVQRILSRASKHWDGGFVITGMMGHGDSFVMRDPSGIRPAFYYHDNEVVVAASERPVIQTAFNLAHDQIKELQPGHALIIKKDGQIGEYQFAVPFEKKSCSFERIYFSRGTDYDIYKERKKLGSLLTPSILKAIDYNLDNTVFSYIPNTASVAFRGLMEEMDLFCDKVKTEKILQLGKNITKENLAVIFKLKPRIEKIAVKDLKLRTFITQDNQRDDLVAHVYDITYGTITDKIDNLVVLDDSIVRGTTLKQSILRILDRLQPKKIIVASSAPQIRYPDCYGIDMAKLNDFIAYRAVIELLKDTYQDNIINEVYQKCKAQENLPKEQIINYVKEIYKPFTAEQISARIAEMLTHKELCAQVQIIYQTIEDLHEAIPDHLGDWYFTGNYPTPGGNRVVNKSFINYIEGRNERAY